MSHTEDTQSFRDEGRLSALFAAYREACPDPEPSANFMPLLWQKIEARQTFAVTVQRFAQAFLTVAAAICILMTVIMVSTRSGSTGFYAASYVETLAAEQTPEALDLMHVEGAGESDL